MNPLKQKWLARVLLLAGALAGGAWLASLDFSRKISHELLDLIPSGERAAELAVVRSLANEKQARVALFALRAPAGGARAGGAAEAFAGALRASPAFAEVEVAGDTGSRDALGRQIFARRMELLLPGWLAGKCREFEAAAGAAAPVGVAAAGDGAGADFSGWLAERAAADLEAFLARPEALAFQEALPADPLLLLPGLVENVMALGGEPAAPDGVTPVWALTRDRPMDEAGQGPVFAAVAAALAAARAVEPGAALRWTGIARFAEENSRRIRLEMSLLNVLSLVAVLGVAAVCLRRVLMALHLAPVVLGAVLGAWVAVTLAFERVHVLVFVIGSLLAGVAIDYGFYLYLQPPAHPGEPYCEKARRLARPLLGSALTTVIGFSLLMFSELPLIRQLGVFVSAGLLAALAAAVLWFAQVREPFMRTRAFARAQAGRSRRGRVAARVALGVIAAAAAGGPWWLHWRDNIRELEIPTPGLRREAAELRALFGESARRTVYLTRGATPGAARVALEGFFAWHAGAFPGSAAASLGQALPLPGDWEAAGARLAGLARGGFPGKFRAALEKREFDAAEFGPFFEAWGERVSAMAEGDYDEGARGLAGALRGRMALLMSTAPGECWFLTVANHAPGVEPPAGSGSISLDQLETFNRLFARYRVSALRLSALGLGLVGLSMWVIYGAGRGARIFATPVGACLFAFGVLGLAGQALNLFHLLGAFLGVCLAHNYAIFTAENEARGEEPPPSIRLSALSTAASFGVLALSRIPVVRALGSTVALIVLGALAIVELKRVARGAGGDGNRKMNRME
jgi:predicted exporter